MKCPKCQFENREGAKFCLKCGEELRLNCPQCGKELPLQAEFCDECGHDLRKRGEPKETVPEAEGERKYVTVLFSDLSGYTAMSEKLDPEEVKEITTRIFGEVSKVIEKYDGFVEKYVGDAVMALFGVPKAHEDDPIRAIKAAGEIHELVEGLSPEIEKKITQPISMHTGINTGLVVTGEVDMVKGTHGVAGDTINLASRLCSLAKAGEILVCPHTCRQAEGHYTFEALEPTKVKGKRGPVLVHKILSPKERPVTIHRLSGLRAKLIGRKVEMNRLGEAVEKLRKGEGAIFSIYGDAGTGKSRLLREFKANLDLERIQWFEGHAYAYAQNIPYFPLIDMLNRVFQVDESDPPETLQGKLESGITELVGNEQDVIPYVGSLYALTYTELEDVNPELWKSRLKSAVKSILTALAKKAPTIFCLEDLQWADPSSIELLRHVMLEIRQPAIVLCVYRPNISLFTSQQLNSLSKIYQEMRLQDLSTSEAQDMLKSLLKTEIVPSDLMRFVQDKAEGNPFYLEELINSLIESGTLVRDDGDWRLTKSIQESDISSSIHGVIAGRLDRLETATKRILQEASVIGRAFLYDILKRITELKEHIDRSLSGLEQLDLIRIRSLQPDLEYIFKHALTQEVVYNGLLKKEREEIHERIGLVMEQIFQDRLPELYETLAFHFARGKSVKKAIKYLIKAGEKSLLRYSVEEAHEHYKKAYDILAPKENKNEEEKDLFIDMLNGWGYVYYYLGDIKEFIDLLTAHKDLAESLDNKVRLGTFYVWLGFAFYMAGKPKDSYAYLSNALKLGEDSDNQKVIGYACTWLTLTCEEMGLFTESMGFGERAQEIAKSFPSDQYLFFKSVYAVSHLNWVKGDTKKVFEGAKILLEYGESYSNNRSMVMGYMTKSFGHFMSGDLESLEQSSKKANEIALDPFYSIFGKLTLGMAYFLKGKFQNAKDVLQSACDFCEKNGIGEILLIANTFLAPTLIAQGHIKQGLEILEDSRQNAISNHRRMTYALLEYILGKVYMQIATGPKPAFSIIVKNMGVLFKNVPFAGQKAVEHFKEAIEVLDEIGAKGFLGTAYLDLGLLYKARKKTNQARECLLEAIKTFKECEAEAYLKQAKEALATVRPER